MNLTWHIVKKDLRALKWPVAVWLLCIVARLGIGLMLLNGDGSEGADWFGKMDGLAKVLGGFEFISFVLTAAVVQQDLLVGTTAFWLTRPISGGRLLRAKLITLALLFGVTPVLVNLPWWLGCGYGIDEIAWAAGETLAAQALAVLIGLLWSVVTDGFARFLMWTLVTLFATPMLTGIISYSIGRRSQPVIGEVISSRFLIVAVLAIVGTAAVVGHQFLTRRTGRSVGGIALTIILIVIAGACWPWPLNTEGLFFNYVIRRAEGQWPASAEPAGVTFSPVAVELTVRQRLPGQLVLKYGVGGLMAGQVLVPVASGGIWSWSDGTEKRSLALGRSDLTEKLAKWVLDPPSTKLAGTSHAFSFVTGVPASMIPKIQDEAPAYALPARFRLMQFVSADVVPLQPGKWMRHHISGERIANVEKEGSRLLVTFIGYRPSPWIDNIGGGLLGGNGDYSQYFLVNRAIKYVDRGGNADLKSTRIGTVFITWRTAAYTAMPPSDRKESLLPAINALADAELIKVTLAEQARFSHEIRVPKVEIAKANP
jgi:hypothetical protein